MMLKISPPIIYFIILYMIVMQKYNSLLGIGDYGRKTGFIW